MTVQSRRSPPDDAGSTCITTPRVRSRCTSPRSRTVPEPTALRLCSRTSAPGKYDIALSPNRRAAARPPKLVVSPDDLNPTVTVEWPKGPPSIRGTVDRRIARHDGAVQTLYQAVQRGRSLVDARALARGGPFRTRRNSGGRLHVDAGAVAFGLHDPVPLTKEIRLAEGEAKISTSRSEGMPAVGTLEASRGRLGLHTAGNSVLPGCDVRLAGPRRAQTDPIVRRRKSGLPHHPGPTGYRPLSRGRDATQTVEIKPAFKDGPQDHPGSGLEPDAGAGSNERRNRIYSQSSDRVTACFQRA